MRLQNVEAMSEHSLSTEIDELEKQAEAGNLTLLTAKRLAELRTAREKIERVRKGENCIY